MHLPRFVLAGVQSGVGKTTLSIGIMAAMKKRNLNIQPFKVGPDYIDPAFHTYITQNKSRNLDSWMLEEETVTRLFVKNAARKDISIVEGVMGLYDGAGSGQERGSTAHVAKILHAPVILIMNGRGMAASAAAQVLGYKLYDSEVNIRAIIINNVSGESHYQLLKEVIERDTKIQCIGYMMSNPSIRLESRHLGLIPSVEVDNLMVKIEQIANMVEETIDINQLLEIAHDVPNICCTLDKTEKITDGLRIGVALDRSFHFYYEDNLDFLKELGANLVFFSPMKDKRLPENIHGLYFGGGFPEVFAAELEQNTDIRQEIKRRIERGIPTYAECGGLMYLTRVITTLEGKRYKMVGVFDAESIMTPSLQRFGYVRVKIEKPCVIAQTKTCVKGHEFHRSIIKENNAQNYVYTVDKVRNNEVVNRWKCGVTKYNALGAYAHIHFYSNPQLAVDFIKSCEKYKKENT